MATIDKTRDPNAPATLPVSSLRSLSGQDAAPDAVMGYVDPQERFRDTEAKFHSALDNLANAGIAAENPHDPAYLANIADIRAATELGKLQYEKMHPWGTPESAHPGVLGKIGHVLGRVGDIAGTAVAPGVMGMIPGTNLNRQMRENADVAQLEKGRQAQIEQERAEPAVEPQEWKPVAGTNWELNTKTGETRQMEGISEPEDRLTEPKTAFDLWQRQNPKGTYEDWMKASAKPPAEPHDAFHEWLSDPQKYESFMKSMSGAKSSMKGAYGQFGPAFLAYHMLNQAYGENPALLPILAPVIAKMFASAGEPMSPNAVTTLATPPVDQPLSPETGAPIGNKMPGAPTGSTRSRAQFALSGVLQEIPPVQAQIKSLSGELGPVQGRWNEFMTGKVGADNPRLSGLRTSLKNIATAWMRLHANSESAREEFENVLARSKTAGDLIANLNAIGQQAQNYYHQELGFGERGGVARETGGLPKGAVAGTLNGKHGYVLNGKFHED